MIYQAAFMMGFLVASAGILGRGDARDLAAGAVIAAQTILVWWQIDNLLAIGLTYLLVGCMFLVFSVKQSGVALGIFSCLMAMLTAAAFLGWMPSEKGQGIAFNYYHYCTVLAWGQIGILGFMGYVGSDLRSPDF